MVHNNLILIFYCDGFLVLHKFSLPYTIHVGIFWCDFKYFWYLGYLSNFSNARRRNTSLKPQQQNLYLR